MSDAAAGRARALVAFCRASSPHAVRLAGWVSLAARVEPALLRKARLELAPGVDAGAESDLWFSPLVGSRSTEAIVLERDVARLLRDELAADTAALKRAYAVVSDVHANAPAAIRLEEELIYLGLRGEDESVIERSLRPALAAFVSDPGRAMEVARWADRAVAGLPPRAREFQPVRLLALGAAARLGRAAQIVGTLEGMRFPDDGAWVLPPAAAQDEAVVGVRLRPGALEVVESGKDAVAVPLPAAGPQLLEVAWEEYGKTRGAVAGIGTTVALPAGITEVRLRTAAGRIYRLATPTGAQAAQTADEAISTAVLNETDAVSNAASEITDTADNVAQASQPSTDHVKVAPDDADHADDAEFDVGPQTSHPDLEPVEAQRWRSGGMDNVDLAMGDASLVDAIVDASEALDQPRARVLCEELIRRVHASHDLFPVKDAWKVLGTLRQQRYLDLVVRVAETLVQTGVTDTRVRRDYAQALIDLGNQSTAIHMLNGVLAEAGENDPMKDEARALLGRAYRQLYIEARNPDLERNRDLLRKSLEHYRAACDDAVVRPNWHAINVVALLKRARRDGVEIGGSWPSADSIAVAILKPIESFDGEPGVWDIATALEACVALGRVKDASRWAKRYAAPPHGRSNWEVRCGSWKRSGSWTPPPKWAPPSSRCCATGCCGAARASSAFRSRRCARRTRRWRRCWARIPIRPSPGTATVWRARRR